ncbi:ABC transporter family substrate-binding protein [Corynebacterium aquatimens]|uniref:ABC-type transport system substrate-binding protein n=1 Tax=Corynebacterium aquatimens TaxID=1190508 RepID=A0A931GQW4_9CORY|nr:ABC transporter family substrate-binding protein [Corynebacterium aquatimens]MBG6121273.1 ABC-type transport system substrate-binding protein [Corynebacterium aquatimens]WJY66177.1 putative monoacyl phosphatidylinositol tetramannoside-binding protein LpqW precursor [Corynebacterium aquatimens]
MKRRCRTTTAAMAVVIPAALSFACTADPGPPPIVEQTDDPTSARENEPPAAPAERSQVQVASQPLKNGLNPHVLADENSTVQAVADLVLPSVFYNGVRDTNLTRDVREIPVPYDAPSGTQFAVRYDIADAAQWSDGTPITGKDFVYLWRGMRVTPGVVNAAGYHAISDVRVTGAAGKTVDVLFSQPVAHWQELFTHLLPSHLLASDSADFASALSDTIPASAGRYRVQDVDRGRGTITLNRNDRFWGFAPAAIDVVRISDVRSTEQAADQLRSKQIAFLDHVPGETTRRTYELIPATQVRMVDGPRELGINVSDTSDILKDPAVRAELASLIDVPLIASIAAGRSADLALPSTMAATFIPGAENDSALKGIVDKHRALRIGADPRDGQAMSAARAIVDALNQKGIKAESVVSDYADLVGRRMPEGLVDAVVAWRVGGDSPIDLASMLTCEEPPVNTPAFDSTGAATPSATAGAAATAARGERCTPEARQLAADVLSGALPAEQARDAVSGFLTQRAVWIPLMRERRVQALGTSIVGPSPQLAQWDQGLESAAQWHLATGPSGPVEPTPEGQEGLPEGER